MVRVVSFRLILAIATALLLGACTDPVSLAMTGASAASAVGTDKTIPDHIMSFALDEECSFRNQLKGRPWCRPVDKETAEASPPQRYCYESIAKMTCYTEENPYETRSQRIP